ncbi:MAG TPA: hypothetical protein VF736_08285 [Pyrinomonadaceae bacterium]|jgi:hypothetical protein
MSCRKLSCALLLASSLFVGCVVEPSTNGNAPGAAAGNSTNGGAPRTGTGPEAAQTPAQGPGAAATPGPGVEPTPAPYVGAVSKLDAYASTAAADLAPEQGAALARIRDEGRRLLALRGYLRAGRDAMSRWAWSRERIEAYERSPEYAAALGEIEKVRREFEAANPGHTLRVNTQVRSLDEQLSKWEEVDSVGRAGAELLARAREELAAVSYPERPGAAEARRFEGFLRGAQTGATPTLAVPGLSPHGQARAFDFQVMRGGQLVAGPSSPGRWDADGWTAKLQDAVRRAGAKFSGPLASPREPWHYDYRP